MKDSKWISAVLLLATLIFGAIMIVSGKLDIKAARESERIALRNERVAATKAQVAEFFVEVIDGEPTIKFRFLTPKEIAQNVSAEEKQTAEPPKNLKWIPLDDLLSAYHGSQRVNASKVLEDKPEAAKLIEPGTE